MLVTNQHAEVKTSTKKFMGTTEWVREQAQKYAKEKRSYVFEIFKIEKGKGFLKEKVFSGYAVPI